ncbi:MAG TPA: pitrilysin family protein, partial [Steroidobacteraceae bacterium]|nr:pitrilysin family protein [Steroidobacteraceae bacterium]
DIESWKVQDLKDFYKKFYAPNNAVMFVVGDVVPEEVFRLADTYFAGIPAQGLPEPVTTREPPQLGERRVRIVREAQAPMLVMAWHAGAAPDRETRVMEVLLSILGGGDSSRLHQRLVEQEQAAVEVGTAIESGFDPGLAWVYAVVPPGGSPARAEAMIDAEIARIAKEGPTPRELAKARNQALAGFLHGLETNSGRAEALGEYEVLHGNYRKLFEAPSVYDGITAEDVKRAAAMVLRMDNRTVGVLEPRPPGAGAPEVAGGVR